MVTFESIKNHFDNLVAKGENAKSSGASYTNTIFKVLNELDGLENIVDCCNNQVYTYINQTYVHPGTRSNAFLAFLK